MLALKKILLQNHNPKQTIVKNIFWLLVAQSSRVLRIITLIYAARVLGAFQYGLFSYILGILGILSFISDIGIDELLTREIAKYEDKQSSYFATSFWMRIFLVFLTGLIIIGAAPHISKMELAKPLIYLAVFMMVTDNLLGLMISYIRGMAKMELEAMVATIMNLTMAIAGFFILMWQPNAKGFLLIYIISSTIALITSTIFCIKVLSRIFYDFKKSIAMQILKDCWPITISGIFNFDIIMLGLWSTQPEIGLYSAGQKIIQILYTLPVILLTGIFPILSAIVRRGDRHQERTLNEKTITIIFLYTLPIVIGGTILAQPILKLIYGEQYIGGVMAFRFLLLNLCLIFPGMIMSNLVLVHNKQTVFVRYTILASFIGTALGIFLIPTLGITGATIANLSAHAINYSLIMPRIKKFSYFEIMPYLKKIVFSSAVMGLLALAINGLKINIVINVFLSGIFYLAFLIVLKEPLIYEIVDILKLIRNKKAVSG